MAVNDFYHSILGTCARRWNFDVTKTNRPNAEFIFICAPFIIIRYKLEDTTDDTNRTDQLMKMREKNTFTFNIMKFVSLFPARKIAAPDPRKNTKTKRKMYQKIERRPK